MRFVTALVLLLCSFHVLHALGFQDPAHLAVESSARAGDLLLTAVDTLAGRLPGATVSVTGPGAETPRIEVTDASGQVRIDDLSPGQYAVEIELPGFDTATLTITVVAGETTPATARLAVGGFAEQVAVTSDAAQRQDTDGFSETLNAEEIAQLPDDPDMLAQILDQLAGGDADFRVNGFEGGELPPKDQIQAVRIRQDPFSPDSMGAGRPRVEIVTRPGMNGWRHEVNAVLRDQSLDAREPFAPTRGQGQTRRLSWNFSGPISRGRTSIAGRLSVRDAFDAQAIVATTNTGSISDIVNTERGRLDGEVRIEHALNAAHTLRVEYQRHDSSSDNLGVGEFNLRERAFAEDRVLDVARISDRGTFGTSAFNDFRIEYVGDRQDTSSVSDAVTLNVQNAFVAGGAQRSGGVRGHEIEVADTLEFVPHEHHNATIGFEGEWGRSRNDRVDNITGTFTFASLEDFAAGRPRQFSRRTGDPLVEFSRYEFSWWVYDGWQVRDNVKVGLGLRHDFQGYVDDKWNFAPRLSVAWTPVADGPTTVNAGVGVFNQWVGDDVYAQTLRLDGTRQRDVIVADPSYSDAIGMDLAGDGPPPSIARFGDDLTLQTSERVSVGVEHRAPMNLRLRFNVFGQFTQDRLRALNVNAPLDGVRPDPAFARITEVRSEGRTRSSGLDTSLRSATSDQRASAMVRYRYTRSFNDSDGAFSLPADSRDPDAEWGPASYDIRHRLYAYVSMRLPVGVRASLSGNLMSGAPYSIRTGFDDNGDTVFNDRPAGVGRNSARGTWRRNVDLRLGWRPPFVGSPEGPRDGGGGGGRGGRGGGGGGRQAKGLELYGRISNLFNDTNYTRFAGVLTSPLFGMPTAAASARQIEFGTRVFF